jgi:hypothetical protein
MCRLDFVDLGLHTVPFQERIAQFAFRLGFRCRVRNELVEHLKRSADSIVQTKHVIIPLDDQRSVIFVSIRVSDERMNSF